METELLFDEREHYDASRNCTKVSKLLQVKFEPRTIAEEKRARQQAKFAG